MGKNEILKLKALSDITSIDIILKFEEVLRNILKITCETLKGCSGTMMLVDEVTGELKMVAAFGLPDDYIERVYKAAKIAGVPLTYSPSGTVLETGKYYLVPDVFKDIKMEPWWQLAQEAGYASQIFTPMKHGNNIIGLLNVYWEKPKQFTDEEVSFISVVASHSSSVVQNAKMCERLKGNIHELNEYKKLETKLKESEEKYRDLFDNAKDPMYTIDIYGYYQSINDAGLQIIGATREEIIGSHMSSLLTPESYTIALEILKKQISCLPYEQPIRLEIICKNGEHRWGDFTTRIMRDGDKIIGIHGIARDITEKKKLEDQLKEYHEKLKKSYEELKESEKLKKEFISNITHELLTPLTSIKGYSELLYNDAIDTTSYKQKKSLEVILRNSDRLISRIKDLLDVAALEKDEIHFNPCSVSINEIIFESVQDLKPIFQNKEIEVVSDSVISSSISGDKEKLNQVITNILSNAIKFTPNGGKITITAGENEDEVKISINDTGIGIPQDKLESIFNRFYQVDGSSSRKYGGFGLGLYICKTIIEKHDGLIWAESNGNGSTFNIVLPKITSKQKGGTECSIRLLN